MAPARWLFVCSGNICRSAIGEALARTGAEARGLELMVESAGTLGIVDEPADPKAMRVCVEIGIDLGAHRSRGLTPELLRTADRILVMTEEHATHALALEPACADRLVRLGPLAGVPEVDDPHGSWFLTPYRRCRDEIRRAVEHLLEHHQRGTRQPG
jgi:protein-tyrosine phosphatase